MVQRLPFFDARPDIRIPSSWATSRNHCHQVSSLPNYVDQVFLYLETESLFLFFLIPCSSHKSNIAADNGWVVDGGRDFDSDFRLKTVEHGIMREWGCGGSMFGNEDRER